MEFETIIKNDAEFIKTINIKKILYKRVLANTGLVIGRVFQLRFDTSKKTLEGIVVKRFLSKPIYLGTSYISKLTSEGIILNIEPSIFLKNRKIIDYEGKTLGKVLKVNRKGNRNDISSLILSSFMRKNLEIPFSAIQKLGKNIILKKDYNVQQKYIWQRSN